MKKAFFTTGIVLIIVGIIAYLAVLYARGYRLDFNNKDKFISGTGLVVLTSVPNGARVFIDGNLTTATDNTINLAPGMYKVRIEKDGYFTWSKNLVVKKEAVTKTDAVLFPSVPKLEAITILGSANPVIDPTNSLIAYRVSSSTAEQNGIYILAANNGLPIISNGTSNTQIASNLFDRFSQSRYEFSPDGKQLLAYIPPLGSTSSTAAQTIYLLDTGKLNSTPQNVTVRVKQIKDQWEILKKADDQKFIASLPRKVQSIALSNFSKILISPERDKILYTASVSAQLPYLITPPLPSTNSTVEQRNIVAGNVYVYQPKEDKNYLLYEAQKGEALPDFRWHQSSNHVVFIKDKKVQVMEFDGGNKFTIYSGPFDDSFFYPLPDGSGVIIRTNLNDESIPLNFYRIGLR